MRDWRRRGTDCVGHFGQDGAGSLIACETLDIGVGIFSPILIVSEELVGNHKGLVLPLLDGLLRPLVVGLPERGEVHLANFRVNLLIKFESLFLLEGEGEGDASVEGHVRPEPGVVDYLIDAYSLVGVDLEHAAYQVCGEGVDGAGYGVVAL